MPIYTSMLGEVRRVAGATALLLALSLPARAHNGPPFPIIVDRQVGPCVVSLWTHPDVGTGTFFVMVSPRPRQTCPENLKIEIGVQPATGRLPEVRYGAWRDDVRGQVQYKSEVAFDAQELWNVRLVLKSTQGDGEATAKVEATPPGLGRWDLLFYASPFLAVAGLWFRAISRKRRRSTQ
ncbi:MAG: hypothetical protein LAO06_09780 [Acidobacteriia bacterium]|nr:hypothetical protein [Terriglobia bacterium]